MKINSLSIFCGAHKGHDSIFEDEAIKLVNLLAEYNIDIVYGGGNVGLMKVISDRAIELGINITGITLKSLNEFEQSVKPVTYSVIKSGLIGLTRYISTYWSDKNVRCNAMCPGGV